MGKQIKSNAPSLEWQGIKGVKRKRLIYERKKRNLTQGQLAKLLNVAAATVSHLENSRMNPSLELELGLTALFDLPSEILFPDL